MSDVRIVTMQQIAVLLDGHGNEAAFTPEELDGLEGIQQTQKRQAEAQLAQAFADGFEIADVTTGSNERVLLTTWTLRLVPPTRAQDVPEGDDARTALYSAGEKLRPGDAIYFGSDGLAHPATVPPGFFPVCSPLPDEQDAIQIDALIREKLAHADLDLRTLKL